MVRALDCCAKKTMYNHHRSLSLFIDEARNEARKKPTYRKRRWMRQRMSRIKIWQSDRNLTFENMWNFNSLLHCVVSVTVEQEHKLKANFPGCNVPATTVLLAKRRPIEKNKKMQVTTYRYTPSCRQLTHTKKGNARQKKTGREHAIYASDFNVP